LVDDSYILPARDLVTSQAKHSARSVVEPPEQFPDLKALVSVKRLGIRTLKYKQLKRIAGLQNGGRIDGVSAGKNGLTSY
jgi:hypothetical protein